MTGHLMQNSRRVRSRSKRQLAAGAICLALILSGCATDPLAEQYREGSGKNYIAGDGSVTEIAPGKRGEPVTFSGPIETGDSAASTDYTGQVLVLNFWYAGCAPCRAEAPDLQGLWEKYQGKGVGFLGVNVRDQVGSAQAFAKSYGITYPSILDATAGQSNSPSAEPLPPTLFPPPS